MLILDQERRGIVILENWESIEISEGSIFAIKKAHHNGGYDTYELGTYATDEDAQKILFKIMTQYREPDYQMPDAKQSVFYMPEE